MWAQKHRKELHEFAFEGVSKLRNLELLGPEDIKLIAEVRDPELRF